MDLSPTRLKELFPNPPAGLDVTSLDPDNVPIHIAAIMDGNGRWATARNLKRTEGHKAGIKGGTSIDSVGMAKSISTSDSMASLGLLNSILKGVDPKQKGKTVFVAVDDSKVDDAIAAIKRITGDLSKPNAGVLFTVPITYWEGLD